MKITITLDENELKILSKRAKKNLLTIKEQAEDIIRRSCVKSNQQTFTKTDSDDVLINIFSRDKRGRKRYKKIKKKK
jgi:hypothetical protein